MKRLASETGAGMVVTGSYHLVGQSLRFHLQVADAIAGALVGAPDEVSATLADPIAGVGELRNRLMGWLAASYDERLKDLALGDHPPRYAAYLAFSEGMDRYIAVDIARATERFLAAHSLDSSFAMALLYGSISLSNQGDWRRADSVLRLIDPMRDRLSGYHRAWLDSRVALVAGRNGEALAAIRRAAAMAPRSKAAYNHAVAAFQAGSLDEARAALDKLDPDRGPMRNFFPYWDVRAGLAHALGDYRREGADGRESRTRYPSRMAARLPTLRAVAATGDLASLGAALADAERLPADQRWWDRNLLHLEVAEELVAHRGLSQAVAAMAGSVSQLGGETPDERLVRARIEYTLGRWSQVATVLDQLPGDFAPIETLGLRGAIAARVGDTAAARAVMSQLARPEEPYQFGASSLARARIAAVLGQPAEALALLRTAFAQGKEFDLWLHRDPDLGSLQKYPPFAAWLRSLRGGG